MSSSLIICANGIPVAPEKTPGGDTKFDIPVAGAPHGASSVDMLDDNGDLLPAPADTSAPSGALPTEVATAEDYRYCETWAECSVEYQYILGTLTKIHETPRRIGCADPVTLDASGLADQAAFDTAITTLIGSLPVARRVDIYINVGDNDFSLDTWTSSVAKPRKVEPMVHVHNVTTGSGILSYTDDQSGTDESYSAVGITLGQGHGVFCFDCCNGSLLLTF